MSVYVAKGTESLHPMDADLNLPEELYSHEVRRRVAWSAAQSSFDEVIEGLEETTSAHVGKRQVEQLVVRAAEDFDVFYKEGYGYHPWETSGPILVITVGRERRRDAARRSAGSDAKEGGSDAAQADEPA